MNQPYYIETRSQGRAWFWDPQTPTYHLGNAVEETVASINLPDIAHALARICRFGGHVSRFYSVAEHAALVADKVYEVTGNPEVALAALHHDDHEAYVGDVPRPLKLAIGNTYKKIAQQYDTMILDAMKEAEPALYNALIAHAGGGLIKAADDWALLYEAFRLLPSRGSVFADVVATWPVDVVPEWAICAEFALDPYGAENRYLIRHETYSNATVA